MDRLSTINLSLLALYFSLIITTLNAQKEQSNSQNKQITTNPVDVETSKSQLFLQKLFVKYGENGKITFEGFEHLLANLGLGNVQIEDHDVHDHYAKSGFKDFHSHHNHTGNKQLDSNTSASSSIGHGTTGHYTTGHVDDSRSENGMSTNGRSNKSRSENEHSENVEILLDKEFKDFSQRDQSDEGERARRSLPFGALLSLRNDPYNECLGPNDLLKTFEIYDNIGESNFLHVCPAIIYQLDEHMCARGAMEYYQFMRCHDALHMSHDHQTPNATTVNNTMPTEARSMKLSVKTWVSALVAVLIISTVGFLCVGVIPVLQKLQSRMYRALLQLLVALAIGTLTGDALLHLIPHAMVPHEDQLEPHSEVQGHPHKRPVFIGVFVLLGVYALFIMERAVGIAGYCKQDRKRKREQRSSDSCATYSHATTVGQTSVQTVNDDTPSSQHISASSERIASSHIDMVEGGTAVEVHEYQFVAVSDDNHTGNHGHSHTLPSNNVSSIVWMVIMGDGFHNFCDGLAIGAAFASSITGGFSTSVAVFCHELPHEIGDFAVLLNAGMPIKQALFYNVISSILCFLGLFIGLFIGNFHSITPWIFAITAGMFIYISLADMLPELSSFTRVSEGRTGVHHFALQCAGILFGLSIMFIIALHEDDLTKLLE